MDENKWISNEDLITSLNITQDDIIWSYDLPNRKSKRKTHFIRQEDFKFKIVFELKHWTCLLKYGNTIEYFDSRGGNYIINSISF